MAKAEAVEVEFAGGERSATRYANSTITANLTEHDQEVTITVRYGQKSARRRSISSTMRRCSARSARHRRWRSSGRTIPS